MRMETSKPSAGVNYGQWNAVKGKIKEKFSKFTEENVESLKGHMDQLSAKIQSVYGYGKEKAESESVAFKATLQEKSAPVKKSALEPMKKPKVMES